MSLSLCKHFTIVVERFLYKNFNEILLLKCCIQFIRYFGFDFYSFPFRCFFSTKISCTVEHHNNSIEFNQSISIQTISAHVGS